MLKDLLPVRSFKDRSKVLDLAYVRVLGVPVGDRDVYREEPGDNIPGTTIQGFRIRLFLEMPSQLGLLMLALAVRP